MAGTANNRVTLVEKNIAFKIAQQFPAYFREHGSELVAMVEHYYKFVESEPNMGVYNTRRMFEYRDIGTTLADMIIYFKKKYMADLPPLDDQTTRVVIKNIMDLYRRKGTEAGLKLFFRMFYEEDIQVKYPAKYMFKPSDSEWKTGIYLQMYPNNNEFYNKDKSIRYDYSDLLSQDIYGSISKAKAVVDKINFVYLNRTLTPIIYLVEVKGKFDKYDDILTRLNGEDVSFGKLNGSADSLIIDLKYGGTTGNDIGDIYDIQSEYGKGGVAIVTELVEEFTGTIDYQLENGGFGYTIENTKILVSNQTIVLRNEDFKFKELEVLRDTAGNQGTVIGQNSISVGLKMEPGSEFDISRAISTVDRGAENFTLTVYDALTDQGDIFNISGVNNSSPGPLYANTGDPTHAKVEELENIETVELITDIIGDFINVPLNSSNFNTIPPATQAMSGTADPVTLATALEDAFDLTPFEIGRIKSFENLNPGENYVTDVFALVRDEQMLAFERYEQIILVDNYSATFSVGDEINQPLTGTTGIITKIDNDQEALYVTPYSYYGFKTGANDSISHKGNSYDILTIERDYTSPKFGENAILNTETLFSTGRIAKAEIRNSGFGYVDEETVFLVDEDGTKHARATLRANSQGITSGFWAGQNSHINGYVQKQPTPKTPILPTEEFAKEVLRVALGLDTASNDLGIWLQSLKPSGFSFADINESGSVSSADAQIFLGLSYGQGTQEQRDVWNEVYAPSLKSQTWFEKNLNDLYVYTDVHDYFDANIRVQDSDYYQEYSYEIRSTVFPDLYEKVLKDTMHLAGSKMFSNFIYEQKTGPTLSAKFQVVKKDDYVRGGDEIVGPNQSIGDQTIRASNFVWTVDTDAITTDNG